MPFEKYPFGVSPLNRVQVICENMTDLARQLKQSRSCVWALERLTTIGEACRAVLRQTLNQAISWVVERAQEDDWNCQKIKVYLGLI